MGTGGRVIAVAIFSTFILFASQAGISTPRAVYPPEPEKRPLAIGSRGIAWIRLQEAGGSLGPSSRTERIEPGEPRDASVADLPAAPAARPRSLVAADLDGDGIVELIAGYATDSGGVLRAFSGPFGNEAGEGKAGVLPDTPIAPDFLASGDFDADGHEDLLAAARGGDALYFFSGDGTGRLAAPRGLALPGTLTAFAAGEINRADGLKDLVVAVSGPAGPAVLVFEARHGALREEPETIALPAEADALAIGQYDGDYPYDLVVAARDRLLIVHGRDRFPPSRDGRPVPAPPFVEEHCAALRSLAMAAGDFVQDPACRDDLALLAEDGTVHVMSLEPSRDPSFGPSRNSAPDDAPPGQAHPSTRTSLREAYRIPAPPPRQRSEAVVESLPAQVDDRVGGPPSAPGAHTAAPRADEGTAPPPRVPDAGWLFKARLSPFPGDDLIVLDPTHGRLRILAAFTGNDGARPESAERPADDAVASGSLPPAAALALDAETAGFLPIRLNGDAQTDLVFLTEAQQAPVILLTAPAASFTVNSTADTADASPGNGICANSVGACTFRAAIQETNALAGSDSINFNLGAGTPAISMANPLPDITSPVTINGATGGATRIELRLHPSGGGLTLAAGSGGSTLRSLVINGSGDYGIVVLTAANRVENCYVGLNAAGTASVSNAHGGIRMSGAGANANVIGGTTSAQRNVISGNGGGTLFAFNGVTLETGASNNVVSGNFIGPDATGTTGIGNAGYGVIITAPAQNNQIGGLAGNPGEPSGNTITTSNLQGVLIAGAGAAGNLVLGNVITQNGRQTIGDARDGVAISAGASGNTVGGSTAGARNVIAGNAAGGAVADGIEINGAGSDLNRIEGNFLGLAASGATALANGGADVRITNGAKNNTVGGSAPAPGTAPGNVISAASRAGVSLDGLATTGNMIQGNLIGTDATGTLVLASGIQSDDVLVSGTGSGNVVGGSTPGLRNVIAGNSNGVNITISATGVTVAGNFIGTNITGSAPLGNGRGVIIQSGATANMVGGSTVSPGTPPGNVISGNATGVLLSGATTSSNTVAGNLIGTDASGATSVGGQGRGIEIADAHDNTIGGSSAAERNIVSGNAQSSAAVGIDINGANASGNLIAGNYIGTDIGGTAAVGNAGGGVLIRSSAHDNTVGGAAGLAGSPPGNVLSGNGPFATADGVELSGSSANLVQGNLIGTDASGAFAVSNAGNGILLSVLAFSNTIGGAGTGLRNIISGNNAGAASDGIEVSHSSSNIIQGNTIGLDRTGLMPVPNAGDGIFLNDSGGNTSSNTIGGTSGRERNIISANGGNGVRLSGINTTANTVSGNFIGLDARGVNGPAGNAGHGVLVTSASHANTIGGTAGVASGVCRGACNLIGWNGNTGVRIDQPQCVSNGIRANAVFSNTSLGIDLGTAPGVTPNDAGDADSGPNALQNYPVLTSADYDGTSTTVTGTLNSTAAATFSIDLFGNAGPDPSGFGEGQTYMGSTTCLTNGAGAGVFSLAAAGAYTFITATATDGSANTSEFSASYVNPMEVTSLLASRSHGTAIDITFNPACGATDHAVFLGRTPIAGSLAWTSAFCGLGLTGAATFDPGNPPPGVCDYFVVVGQHATREGSYGLDSNRAQRPEAVGVGACDRPQALTVTCF